jgi:hypothetical protein
MDWYHRQIDEIVASLSNLPDIKIVLPELSGLAFGWIYCLIWLLTTAQEHSEF